MRETFIIVGVIIIATVVVCFAGYCVGWKAGHRAGQIKAITGDVRWSLQEQENGEVKWQELKP